MRKKILVICLLLLCAGCGEAKTIKQSNGESKTYAFFKDFDVNHYYVSFLDRNVSQNDNTKIVMARDGDKYYYEIGGESNRKIIQKDGIRYTINESMHTYFKEEASLENFSIGVLPTDKSIFKTLKYESGYEKIYGVKYIYEKYKLDSGEVTYYFKGNNLIYVRYKEIQSDKFLKFNSMKFEFSEKIFDVDENYIEMTY